MLACAESNFSNFKFEYLCKNKFLRKAKLACLSGDQMGLIIKKNIGKKSLDTAPLKTNKKSDQFKIDGYESRSRSEWPVMPIRIRGIRIIPLDPEPYH